jgi:hypothetical protein
MAFSQTDLDAIDAAIASGELTVKSNGREVTYRSMDDLLKARSTVQSGITASVSGRKGGSFRYTFATGRGE